MAIEPLRIICVDDNPDIIALLRAVIGSQRDMEIVECFDEARAALRYLDRVCLGESDEAPPDVVLMDWAMPGITGEEATAQIAQCWKDIKVLVVSAYRGSALVQHALDVGARGVVCKTDGPQAILDAIRDVMRGELVTEPC